MLLFMSTKNENNEILKNSLTMKILVPTDFSKLSRAAVDYDSKLAKFSKMGKAFRHTLFSGFSCVSFKCAHILFYSKGKISLRLL